MLLSHWLAVSTLSTVTRSNITMMSGPNRLFGLARSCPIPAGKMVFPVISAHMQSSIICCLEQQHPPLSPAPLGCPRIIPRWNDAVSFDTGVAYFKSSLLLVFFRSLLAAFQTWIRFPVPLSQHHCTAVILSLS